MVFQMNFKESDKLLLEQYPRATTLELQGFNKYITSKQLENKLDLLVHELVRSDTRTTYQDRFPKREFYETVIANFTSRSNQVDFDNADIIEKLRLKSPQEIISICRAIRKKEIGNVYLRSIDIECLHAWEILVVEEEHAKKSSMDSVELIKYLEYIKTCIIKRTNFERPYINDYKFLEFKRSCMVETFADIKGKL